MSDDATPDPTPPDPWKPDCRYIADTENVPASARGPIVEWAEAWGEWHWAQAGDGSGVDDLAADLEVAYDQLVDALITAGAVIVTERDGLIGWRDRTTGAEGFIQLTCQ